MSRLVRHRETRRPPSRSYSRALYGSSVLGDGRDAGRYYRCSNCGFICDIERNSQGGLGGFNGNGYTENIDMSFAPGGCVKDDKYVLGTLGSDLLGQAAVPSAIASVADRGCPLCGKLDWKAEYK